MRWFKVHNYFESIRPLYIATKLLHFHFESIDFKNRKRHRTLLDQLRFILILLADVYLTVQGIQSTKAYLRLTDSVLVNVGFYSAIVLTYFFGLALASKMRLEAKTIFLIITNIEEFDVELQTLGVNVNHQRHHFISTVNSCLWMTMGLFVLIVACTCRSSDDWLDLSEMFPDWTAILVMFRSSTSLGMFTCLFSLTLLSLKNGFDKLHEATEKCLSTTSRANLDHTCHLIRKLASMQDLLSDTVDLFNRCYWFQALHALTSAFSFTVFTMFSLIHTYAGNVDETSLRVAWANVMYDGFFLVLALRMIVMAGMVNDKCKRTSTVVHKAISYGSYHRRVAKELGIFSLQLRHHVPKVSCVLFDLDWILVYSMAGSFATYLVVLLQFDLANLSYG